MMQAKEKGFCQETVNKLFAEMDAEHMRQRAKGSTAERYTMSAKGIEARVRFVTKARGITKRSDFRARGVNVDDGYIYIDGHRYSYDCKTGGTVGKPQPDGSWTEADILPKAQYVIFPVIDRIEDDDDVLDMSVIFTREEWLELCATCSRKGLRGTFHSTSGNTVIAFQKTPLDKLRRKVEEMLNEGEGWVLRDYEAT